MNLLMLYLFWLLNIVAGIGAGIAWWMDRDEYKARRAVIDDEIRQIKEQLGE